MSTTTTSYAVCNDCGLDLPTPDDAQAHRTATMAAVDGSEGATRRSHQTRVVNPTPEEIAESSIRREVENAITDAMESIDRLVDRGTVTREQVTAALCWYPDFADEWAEWNSEADR